MPYDTFLLKFEQFYYKYVTKMFYIEQYNTNELWNIVLSCWLEPS